jgi:hypothetical protein
VRKSDINKELQQLTFDFYYWFSRFEFSMKENEILKDSICGKNAEPGWDVFVEKYLSEFSHSNETNRLLELNPKRQKVGANSELVWKDVGLLDCKSELCKIVRLLKTIRNNLFHGGKHGAEGWDDPERTKELLIVGKLILDQLAKVADLEADYTQYY